MSDEETFAAARRRVAAGASHRVEASQIVAAMSVEEKLGCLDGDSEFWAAMADLFSGGIHRHAYPAAAVPRLGVPPFLFSDGPRGCVISPSTAFPVSMARGATFDPELEEEVGEAIGAEQRANGATYSGAVCMNLLRHPAWGRAQETYGEDPHHVGTMAAALARGLQRHVMACMKHFALNSLENKRFTVDVTVDERSLHEVYLPHFKQVVDAGVASVMSAYNLVNGVHCGESRLLLTEILRDEWGFDGFVTSDWILGIRDAVGSVEAGLDVEMPARQVRAMALADAVDDGRLSIDAVDRCVENVVATQLRFAEVLAKPVDPAVRASAAHLSLARRVAARSMVVLKNEGGLLPVDATTTKRIAVVGPLATARNLGDAGSSAVRSPHTSTPADGIASAFPDAAVEVVENIDEIAAADLTVVVVGYTRRDEGEYINPTEMAAFAELFPPPADRPASTLAETQTPHEPDDDEGLGGGETVGGDRRSLRLHVDDEALIAAVAERTDRFVVLIVAGSAVVVPWIDLAPAVLQVWYAGSAGGAAMGDVLSGAAEPSGRLPFAVPFDEAHLVDFDPDATAITYGLLHGQWLLDAADQPARFPFGYGLGYGSVSIAMGALTEDRVDVEVTNNGDRSTSTVVQVYAGVDNSAWERPRRRLVGFKRVSVEAGATQAVEVPIDLGVLDVRSDGSWITEPGTYIIEVGLHAGDVAGSSVLVRDAGTRTARTGE